MKERLTFNEGIKLLKEAPLEELQKEAHRVRMEKIPQQEVTFVLDSNPNYTNVCNAYCSFCAFYRTPNQADAYTKSIDEALEHVDLAKRAGLSTVMFQGGLNDELKIDYYVALVKETKRRYPDMFPHYFTAPELWNVAKVSNLSIKEVLEALWEAGLRTIPGGGAEVLSERVRLKISPLKMEPDAWMDVHTTAHELGYRSTATMMYGHVENPEDIVTHLDQLREAQDNIPGFTAFIPWSYKRDNTALRRKVKHWAGNDTYLRIIAFSRLYLDNFDHVQASWFSEGKEVGIEALNSGADDFGGIIFEENVHRATGFIHKVDHQKMLDMIREAGFNPVERNPLYEILRRYDEGENVEVSSLQKEITSEQDRLVILQS